MSHDFHIGDLVRIVQWADIAGDPSEDFDIGDIAFIENIIPDRNREAPIRLRADERTDLFHPSELELIQCYLRKPAATHERTI